MSWSATFAGLRPRPRGQGGSIAPPPRPARLTPHAPSAAARQQLAEHHPGGGRAAGPPPPHPSVTTHTLFKLATLELMELHSHLLGRFAWRRYTHDRFAPRDTFQSTLLRKLIT
ncbi:unnamed protein product, partial [Iphiclides podalirius]